MVCDASAEAGHRIRASLFKLENVVDVDDIAQAPNVTRELALMRWGLVPFWATRDGKRPPLMINAMPPTIIKTAVRASEIFRAASRMSPPTLSK